MSIRSISLAGLTTLALGSMALLGPTTSAAPTAAPTAPAVSTTHAACSARGHTFRPVNVQNVPWRARYTARHLQTDAKDCDKRALVWRATRDRTSLSFGLVTPSQAFAIPDVGDRYWYLAKALTLRPGTQHAQWADIKVWPRVATAWHASKDSAWQELVTSGMYSQAEVDAMRRSGIGYTGWRVGVSHGGRWMFDIAGD